jgi:lipooligosaccharide transport system permease protein
MIPDTLWGVWCVWRRFFSVFVKSLPYYAVVTFLEPLLYLFSFGIGLGALVGTLDVQGVRLTYRAYVFSGIVAQTVLFQGFFEGAFGAFVRMYYQRIFQSIAITPITLSEVLWGELLWDASKSTAAAMMVVIIGVATGDFPARALLTVLPAAFAASLLFSAMGLAAAGLSRTIDELSYPQYLVVFPMFLFCGVFYPITNLPVWLQKAVWFFPLTPVVSIMHTLTLGLPLEAPALPAFLAWTVALVLFARKAMFRRLVK